MEPTLELSIIKVLFLDRLPPYSKMLDKLERPAIDQHSKMIIKKEKKVL
jgi:hypothetical protein